MRFRFGGFVKEIRLLLPCALAEILFWSTVSCMAVLRAWIFEYPTLFSSDP